MVNAKEFLSTYSNDITGDVSNQLLLVLEKLKDGNFEVLALDRDEKGEEEMKFFQWMFDSEEVRLSLHQDVDAFEDSDRPEDYELESAGYFIEVQDFFKVLQIPKDKVQGGDFIDMLYDVFGYLNIEMDHEHVHDSQSVL